MRETGECSTSPWVYDRGITRGVISGSGLGDQTGWGRGVSDEVTRGVEYMDNPCVGDRNKTEMQREGGLTLEGREIRENSTHRTRESCH